ncbi:hypothetical protein QA860_08270 [Streptomyces stelliscabiei]|uniref:hypothetical protein n=1 Tax=Streptomyces stelliscabiei TaxID=146820 RepID=UPI0029B3FC41|nr:hypothetical protein [Streptomyces stelliscabiei]MDX2550133.1 hypothetical protein [Streptomyces stelliscabiei]
MKLIAHIASETWRVIRYLATGRTNSRRDRQALASYWRYQTAERVRERHGNH